MIRTIVALLVIFGLAAVSAPNAFAEPGLSQGLEAGHSHHLVADSGPANADCVSAHHAHSAFERHCSAICAGLVGLVAFERSDVDRIWLPSPHNRLIEAQWVGRPPELIDPPPKSRLF